MEETKDDLDKISDVILGFFESERITRSLAQIHKYELTGWEKWWQTELALYLATEDELIAEWDMEHPFEVDNSSRFALSASITLGPSRNIAYIR